MIRTFLTLVVILIVYYAVKTVIRSALKAYHGEGAAPAPLKGQEMVLDPECRTYIIRDRAVSRRLGGKSIFFCSEACAERYEANHRG